MATAEKSDFIGGARWHVPQPDPSRSECSLLVSTAQNGDKNALQRCQGLYENFKPRRKPARKPPAPKKPVKKPVKRKPKKVKRS